MRAYPKTVAELREFLADIPDDTPILRRSDGYLSVWKQDVGFWFGRGGKDDRGIEYPVQVTVDA
jgi:hypothetical protein